MVSPFVNKIFDENINLASLALEVFGYQYANNTTYHNWCDCLQANTHQVTAVPQIPFLPISFFKTHRILTGSEAYAFYFESSGTTQGHKSRHYVKEALVYQQSFTSCFRLFYGDVKNWCIIGLLPSYLQQQHSSLVQMVDELIRQSGHAQSGFYLDEYEKLHTVLQQLEARRQKTLLIGVTYALLDFAKQFPQPLSSTTIMETGGMKGRRKELTRNEVHAILEKQFGLAQIHSEYGMSELLSQAYSKADGRFFCPPWMKVLVRDEDDPLLVKETGKGALNIIDLANINSCAFIGTDDVGEVFKDGSFTVAGRLDGSDIRGCSLMVI